MECERLLAEEESPGEAPVIEVKKGTSGQRYTEGIEGQEVLSNVDNNLANGKSTL